MKFRSLFIASLAFLTSCETSHIDTFYTPSEEVAFFISPNNNGTKGRPIGSALELSNIGVFASRTQRPYGEIATHKANFMFNQLVERAGFMWQYNPIQKWSDEPNELVSFFAYTPYANTENGLSIVEESGKIPSIRYQVPQTNTLHPDLMVAQPVYDRVESDGAVGMSFRHALAAVSFSVKGDPTRIIESVKLSNVVAAATLALDNQTIAWGDHDDRSPLFYDLGIKEDITPPTDGEGATSITAADGYLMMIPQEITSVKIEVQVEGETEPIDLNFESGSEWVAGSIYNYLINLDDETIVYDISQTSNCYIVNNTSIKEVYIPVDQRINAFWSNYSGLSKTESKKYMLETDTDWNTKILWYDNAELSTATAENYRGTVPDDCTTSKSYVCDDTKAVMKVTLPANKAIGNILVAVTKKFGTEEKILWSWHLWVTDYNPDSEITPTKNSVKYNVTNGQLHRYTKKSENWTTGVYANSYTMDRDIGSHDKYSVKGLFYQWGRKDPFSNSIGWQVADSAATFVSAVQNPNIFYATGAANWHNEAPQKAYNKDNYLWNDLTISNNEANAFTKSIFDPSPLGWCVPLKAAYSEWGWRNDYSGIVYFDITGHIFPIGGEIDEDKETTSLWCADKPQGANAHFFYVEELTIGDDIIWVPYGHRIRPVKIPN